MGVWKKGSILPLRLPRLPTAIKTSPLPTGITCNDAQREEAMTGRFEALIMAGLEQ